MQFLAISHSLAPDYHKPKAFFPIPSELQCRSNRDDFEPDSNSQTRRLARVFASLKLYYGYFFPFFINISNQISLFTADFLFSYYLKT